MEVIKVSKDMNKMKEVMEKNEAFRHLEVDAVRMLNQFTNLKIEIKERMKTVDMCKAWEDWKNYNFELGIEKGIEKGKLNMLEGAEEIACTVEELERLMVEKGYHLPNLCGV